MQRGISEGRFRIGLIQLDSSDDWDANRRQAELFIREAAEEGAAMAVLPETSDYIGTDFRSHAFAIPGPKSDFYREQAVKYGIYLHCGSLTEQTPDGIPRNTSLVFGPDGRLLGKYSKLHLFDVELTDGPSYRESDDVSGGGEIVLIETALCSLGLSICYDMRFPEMYRLMAEQGAELLINCANFTENTGKAHWEALLRARAIENTCYVAAVGQCGQKPKFRAWGHTMLIDPWGEITAKLQQEDEPGLAMGEVDPERLRAVRSQVPSLKNRRTDVYRLESENVRVFRE